MASNHQNPQASSLSSSSVPADNLTRKRSEPPTSEDDEDTSSRSNEKKPKKDGPQCSELTSVMEDFPVDSANPFEAAFCGSDVVLIVEGHRLHAHRLFLSLYSPYFRVMFNSRDFVEAGAREIELQGKAEAELAELTKDNMVKFLRCIYPVKSLTAIAGE